MSNTENIRYLIDAEDKATAKFKQVNTSIDENVKQVKELGGRAKAATEFTATLANTLGGTHFGSAAGQLAQITERVSTLSEVMKAGGAGVWAFKAGVGAAVAATSYGLGYYIASLIVDIEGATSRLEKAQEASSRALTNVMGKLQEKLQLESQIAAHYGKEAEQKHYDKLTEKINQLNKTIGAAKNPIDAAAEIEMVAIYNAQRNAIDSANNPLRQRLEYLNEQEQKLKSGAAYVQKLRDELSALEAPEGLKEALDINRNVASQEQFSEATAIKKKIDLLKTEQELKAKIAKDEADNLRRVNKLRIDSVESIQREAVELALGKKEAIAFGLRSQGIENETAQRIATLQMRLDELRNTEAEKPAGENRAVESRLQSGKVWMKHETEAERNVKITAMKQAESVEILKEVQRLLTEIKDQDTTEEVI